jgi:hypothetical protein
MFYKNGIIKSIENGKAIIEVDLGDDARLLERQGIKECEVGFTDGRKISVNQRKYIYALIKDVAESVGLNNELMKEALKNQFCLQTGAKDFSLSTVDMSTAKDFLNFLVEFCVSNEVDTKIPLSSVSDASHRYTYACCMNNKCCLTGKQGVVYDIVNLTDEIEVGAKVLCLSEKAIADLKRYGDDTFVAINYVTPIEATEDIVEAAREAARIRESEKETLLRDIIDKEDK